MYDLTREGKTYLEAGDNQKAQNLFIESLRQDIRNAESWFWLAMTLEVNTDRARCLRYVIQLADPFNEVAEKGLVYLSQEISVILDTAIQNPISVTIPVAGVNYKDRQSVIRELRIGQGVLLRREPYNPYDINAIRVETESGLQVGYVPREVASVLSPFIDELQKLLPARVTELIGGYLGEYQAISVKVTFCTPSHLELPPGTYEYLEYYYDDTGTYCYILLNCNEDILKGVKSELQNCGIKVLHSGTSSRLAPNSHFYKWFIRIAKGDNGETAKTVENLFENVYGVLSNEARTKRLEQEKNNLETVLKQAESDKDALLRESVDILDESGNLKERIRQKDAEIESLKYQLEQKQEALDSQKRAQRIQESTAFDIVKEVRQIITSLLPNVEFLRDSLEFLSSMALNKNQALSLLQEIRYSPEKVKAKKFESTPGFRELHFGGDGRIYFRTDNNKRILVLVSNKDQQKEDERYLKKHA